MPAKLNIGLSRKVGEANYGSRGASAHLEVELDAGVVSDPQLLRDRMRSLYAMARQSVEEELFRSPERTSNEPAHSNGNRHANGNRHHTQPAGGTATQSQARAILSIARRHRLDPNIVVQERFHLNRVEDLSIRQASELIDALKNGMDEVQS